MKKGKKKVTAAAAAGVAAVGAAVINRNDEQLGVAEPMEGGESVDALVDGGELPEITVTGDSPIADGGVLPELDVYGHAVAGTVDVVQDTEVDVAQSDDITVEPISDVAANADVQVAAEIDMADITEVASVQVPEEEFLDEFDDSEDVLSQMDMKKSDGSVIDEFIDKAEEFLGVSDEPDMPDFNNAANVNEFTNM